MQETVMQRIQFKSHSDSDMSSGSDNVVLILLKRDLCVGFGSFVSPKERTVGLHAYNAVIV